ncbi:beta-ketoacyl synthase N-terminal-like domain-containing protein [Streptomyces collinus]|uniref:beta-ketoacyl synthase N-terminal-like domain-containing protein n=1 Tax=Streptomyces collinus TaxID=42684 RepID=UPI0037D67559
MTVTPTGTTSVRQPAVVAAAVVDTATERGELPGVPGFVVSAFNPLVRETVRRCLGDPGTPDVPNPLTKPFPDSTAIVLATVAADATTSDTASQKLLSGRVHNPLLFFQSVTTSIVGHLAIEYGLTGPIHCVAADHGADTTALDAAALLLLDDTIDQVLVIGVELAANPRTAAAFERLAALGHDGRPPAADLAVALLLRRPGATDRTVVPAEPEAADPGRDDDAAAGHLYRLAALAERARRPLGEER